MSVNNEYLEKISKSLNQLVKVKTLEILQSEEWIGKSNGEKILFLHKIGFSNEEITNLIETTIGTVKKEISVRKK